MNYLIGTRKLRSKQSNMVTKANLKYEISTFGFYRSKDWKNLKEMIFKCYDKTCFNCKSKEEIHADHIKPISSNPELALDFYNIQVLCKKCNMEKSNKYNNRFGRIFKKDAIFPTSQEIESIKSLWVNYFKRKSCGVIKKPVIRQA